MRSASFAEVTGPTNATTPTTSTNMTLPTPPIPVPGIGDCAQGEMFTLCSTAEATCANLVPARPRQQPRYGPPKCQCLPGYVRQSGACVPHVGK